jgi:hypothetical protein
VSKSHHAFLKPFIISCLAALAMMAVWFTLSAHYDAAITWFALIAALDIALLERWTRSRDRTTAVWIAPVMTLLCCLASLWLIAALSVRYAGGFTMNDSARQMGAGLFAALINLRFAPLDWLYIAASPVLAALLANAGDVNDRRQSP